MKLNPQKFQAAGGDKNDSNEARPLVPPILLREGEKTQPDWLFRFLRDPHLIRRALHKLAAERYPGESTRGMTTYAVMRALQIRRFRMPKPRLKPGDKF